MPASPRVLQPASVGFYWFFRGRARASPVCAASACGAGLRLPHCVSSIPGQGLRLSGSCCVASGAVSRHPHYALLFPGLGSRHSGWYCVARGAVCSHPHSCPFSFRGRARASPAVLLLLRLLLSLLLLLGGALAASGVRFGAGLAPLRWLVTGHFGSAVAVAIRMDKAAPMRTEMADYESIRKMSELMFTQLSNSSSYTKQN